jgi:hypothetical protein
MSKFGNGGYEVNHSSMRWLGILYLLFGGEGSSSILWS